MQGFVKEKIYVKRNGLWVLHREYSGNNQLHNNLVVSAPRALSHGILAPTGPGKPVVHMAFKFGAYDYLFGLKPSNDTPGVDLIGGGDGVETFATFSAYAEVLEDTTIESIHLVYYEQDLELGSFEEYGSIEVNRYFDADSKYTIDYTVNFY